MTSASALLDAGAMLAMGGLGVLCAWAMPDTRPYRRAISTRQRRSERQAWGLP
jgi:hypothetical protein